MAAEAEAKSTREAMVTSSESSTGTGRPVAAFQPASKSLEAAKAAPAMTTVVATFSMVA